MTPPSAGRSLGDTDTIDAPIAPVDSADRAGRRWPSRRLALGLSPTPRPALILLLAGMALGPHGLGVLSDSVVASLDPAVSAALAALGVLVGLEVKGRRPREGRLLAAASLEAGVTILTVAAGVLIVHALSSRPEQTPWLLALMLGVCAAPSSTAADRSGGLRRGLAARIGDLDDVLPIVLAVLAVAWTRAGTPGALAWVVAQGGVIAVSIAFATRLLIKETSSESEQRVFAIGALLLLGGAAAHLSLSALFAGFLAGVFWSVTGGPASDHVARDVRYLQHPLMVLLLVVAGSRLELPTDVAGLVVAYVVLRIVGKLVGGWLAGRVAARELPYDLGFSLSAPGVVGVAMALNVLQARGESEPSATIFAVVIAGTLGAELLSLLGSRRDALA